MGDSVEDGVCRNIKIGIIGSGMAGLSAGITLCQHGFKHVNIFERDDSFERRRQGYGLTMLQGIRALKSLQVFESVKDIDTPSRAHYIFDSQGNIVSFFGTIFWAYFQSEHTTINSELSSSYSQLKTKSASSKSTKKYNLHISRQNLRRILCRKLNSYNPEGLIHWDKRLQSISSKTGNKWVLTFDDSTEFEADLIIGADGINSLVRKYKFPHDNMLNYLGILLVLGITKTDHYLSEERVFQTVDGNTRLFAMPFFGDEHSTNGNIMWQLSFPVEEIEAEKLAADLSLLKAVVLEKCRKWHEPIPSLINSTPLNLLIGIVGYDRDPFPPSSGKQLDGIIVIGDAAHPMSPFKGQGANQALLDGVSLANHLANASSISSAVSSFENEMWDRVKPKVLDSRKRVKLFHEPNVLDGQCFCSKGLPKELLEKFQENQINVHSGENLEDLILEQMKSVPVINGNFQFST